MAFGSKNVEKQLIDLIKYSEEYFVGEKDNDYSKGMISGLKQALKIVQRDLQDQKDFGVIDKEV